MSIENRNITLTCPVCGNDQFSCVDGVFDDLSEAPDEVKLRCVDCGSIFTKGEIIESNQDVINANIEDIKNEAMQEIQKSLKKIFR